MCVLCVFNRDGVTILNRQRRKGKTGKRETANFKTKKKIVVREKKREKERKKE